VPEPTNQPNPGPEGTEQEPFAPESSTPEDPQATVLLRKERSLIRDVIYIVVLVVLIGSATVLLVSSNLRTRVLQRVGQSWQGVTGSEQAEIFELPAPPAKSVPPKVIYQGTSGTGVISQGDRPPIVIRSPGGDEEEAAPIDETKPPAPPEKTDASKAAYESLLQKSPVAQKIATGAYEGYKFKEWRPTRNAPPEFLVDLVATGPSGRDSHFVWMINTESGAVEAMSQDARDAQRRVGGR